MEHGIHDSRTGKTNRSKEAEVRKRAFTAMVMGMALVLAALAPAAWAGQNLPAGLTPGAVEKSLQPRVGQAPAAAPEIRIGQDSTGKLQGGDGVEFKLTEITFDGNQVFTDQELAQEVAPFIGLVIGVNDLAKVVDTVTNYYVSRGYILSRAYLPQQSIKDGKVIIAMVEGRLGAIYVKGNQRYKADLVRRVMDLIRKENAVTTEGLERSLLLLNDYPGLSVKSTLVRGQEPGTTDIVVDVTEAKWWQAGFDYNNFGSEYVSPHRLGFSLTFLNPFGYGDRMSFRYMTGTNGGAEEGPLWYLRADYDFPVNRYGTRVGVALSRLNYDLGQELEILDIEGRSDLMSVWASHPIIRTRNLSLWADAGFDIKRIQNKMFDQLMYEEDLHNLRFGSHIEWLDGHSGQNLVTVNVTKGLSDDEIGSRLYADGNFLKGEASYRRIQALPYNLTGLFSIFGQYSGARLPTAEEFSAGGAGTVRGWAMGDYSGDHGLVSTVEVRYPLLKTQLDWQAPSGSKGTWGLDAALFSDYGRVWVKDPIAAEQSDAMLWGWGLGLRAAWAPYGMAKIDYARPLKGDKPLDEGLDERGAWYLQLSLTY